MTTAKMKPIVLITGSAGKIGTALKNVFKEDYQVVGFDMPGTKCDIEIDLTSIPSVKLAFKRFKEQFGDDIACVIHLAAYFDFSGNPSPLYETVNEQGTKRLLEALQGFKVERFIFSSTMLVHQPCEIGERLDEHSPIAPKWAYPQSKANTEAIIARHHGDIPYLILRLAGLYDDETCVPTLANQIARTYERDVKSHLYAGNPKAGQAFIHQDDLVNLFVKAVQHRHDLDEQEVILAGEPDKVSYEKLQATITRLIHDESSDLYEVPAPVAKVGAWLEEKSEPIIPDDFDQGEKPFIRPFMIEMASDEYALNINKAREKLNWQPQHNIIERLPKLIQALKKNPKAWYEKNGMTAPDWMKTVDDDKNAEDLRLAYEASYRKEHQQFLWAHFLNIGLGFWLLTSPMTLGYQSMSLSLSDMSSGVLLVLFALMSLSWRLSWARWCCAFIGLWLIFAPLVFWAPTATAYLNDTLIGSLVIGFSVLVRPDIGVAMNASMQGPDIPVGWQFSPSSWFQRLPIIILAFIGLFISRYLAAYQLGHIDSIWDPFFSGVVSNPKNGTEEIITSYVSEAWPVPDAGLGAAVYILEILTGIIGGTNRWRTMPWLVLLFGIMIVPLGAVSITFIIIQPILLNTWCTLCLIAAIAMLAQVPYSFDEIIATSVFLWRRYKAGRPILKVLFVGDTEEQGASNQVYESFEQPPGKIIREMLGGGVTIPWNLMLILAIGIWLMFTRLTLNTSSGLVDIEHLIGALVVTFTVTALAEVVRALRFINVFLGLFLVIAPFIYDATFLQMTADVIAGIFLILLSFRRGKIRFSYGAWNKFIF